MSNLTSLVCIDAAKNIVLAGVHSVVVCDPTPCTLKDRCGQFYITQAHIDKGISRFAICAMLH